MFIDWIVCAPSTLKPYAKALTDRNDALVNEIADTEIHGSLTTVGLFPEDVLAVYRGLGGQSLEFKDLFRDRPARVYDGFAFFAALPQEFCEQLAGAKLDNQALERVREEMKRVAHAPDVRRDPAKAEARAKMVSLDLLEKLKDLAKLLETEQGAHLYSYIVAETLNEPNSPCSWSPQSDDDAQDQTLPEREPVTAEGLRVFMDWVLCTESAIKRQGKALAGGETVLLYAPECVGGITTGAFFPEDILAVYRGFGGRSLELKDLLREPRAGIYANFAFFAELPLEFCKQVARAKLDKRALEATREEMKQLALDPAVPAVRRDPKKAKARGKGVTLELLQKLKHLCALRLECDDEMRLYCYIVADALGQPN